MSIVVVVLCEQSVQPGHGGSDDLTKVLGVDICGDQLVRGDRAGAYMVVTSLWPAQ